VLSPTTERYDREQKRLYYQQLDSLREYVLVAQDHRSVEVWRRDGSRWVAESHRAGQTVSLTSIGYMLDIDELYAAAGVC
jgi:Uma2 family endonuclease